MNKEIEELTGDICYACHSRKVCTGENCAKAQIVAEELYNVGYRKLTDHAIMVLRKAHNMEERIRKETAEEILQEIKSREMWFINSHIQGDHLNEQIDEIAKEYGVEIER